MPSLPLRDLWNPDEPRYAEVAREMLVTGEWLVPHLNGDLYSEKPPLFFWLSALGQAIGLGFSAGRVVAGLACLGTLLLTWSLARRLLGDRAALLSAAVLGTAVFFPWLSRFGVLDVVLTFFVTLAVCGWIRGGTWTVLFYAGMGLAVLVKGPVGIVLAVFGALAWRMRGGAGGEAAAPRPPLHYAWGPLLTAGIVAAWLWPACVRGGDAYTDAILWKQNVGRAVQSWSHARPFWYYVPYVLGLFFPWVLFLPWAAPWAWKQKGLPRAMLLFTAIGFLFFSFVSGKRDRYLTPLFPPLSIVVGAWLGLGVAAPLARRAARFGNAFFLGAGIGLLVAALLGGVLAERFAHEEEVAAALEGLATLPGIATAAAFAGALFLIGRRGIRAAREGLLPRAALFLALEVAVFLLAHDLLLVPRIDGFKSPRPVAEELNRWPGEVAAYPAHFSGAYNLYSGRIRIPVLDTPEEVLAYLDAPGRRLVLTSRENYERAQLGEERSLKDALEGRFRETSQGRVGHREMLFLTNYEPPP